MKQILYIANMRLPSERAHSVHVVEMCAALSAVNGGNVFLLVPNRATSVEEKDVFKYYGVPRNFEILRSRSFDAFRLPISRKLAFYLHAWSFARSAVKILRSYPDAVILSRDLYTAYKLAKQGRKVAFEVHDFPGVRAAAMLREIPRIITTNNWKKEQLVKQFKIDSACIFVAPNAVDFKKFSISSAPGKDMREEMKWPRDKKMVLYTGSLYAWKGVHTLAKAAKFIDKNAAIVFVGGGGEDRKEFREFLKRENLADRVILLPHRPHGEIAQVLSSASVLVVPTSAKEQIGEKETSPIKIFEYLGAQKPIVASDVASSREVLDESRAIFFRPDDPKDCARAITEALNMEPATARKMMNAQNAFIKTRTWEARARNILDFISL